jgi:hypothetical protein
MNCPQMEAPTARSLIDIGSLDVWVQEEVAEHASMKDFSLTLWRQDPDSTGCNWNARIRPTRANATGDSHWRDVVPEMRRRFNLN